MSNNVPYPRFEYWLTDNQWYWHLQAANGRIVGSASGFDSEAGVLDAIDTFCRLVSLAAHRYRVRI